MKTILPPYSPQAARCCVPATPAELRVVDTPAGSRGRLPVPWRATEEDRPTDIEELRGAA